MTRETKVGLVVAGSFLCLVGIVVASKWNRGDGTDAEEQTVVPTSVLHPTQNSTDTKPSVKIEPQPPKPAPMAEAPRKKEPAVERTVESGLTKDILPAMSIPAPAGDPLQGELRAQLAMNKKQGDPMLPTAAPGNFPVAPGPGSAPMPAPENFPALTPPLGAGLNIPPAGGVPPRIDLPAPTPSPGGLPAPLPMPREVDVPAPGLIGSPPPMGADSQLPRPNPFGNDGEKKRGRSPEQGGIGSMEIQQPGPIDNKSPDLPRPGPFDPPPAGNLPRPGPVDPLPGGNLPPIVSLKNPMADPVVMPPVVAPPEPVRPFSDPRQPPLPGNSIGDSRPMPAVAQPGPIAVIPPIGGTPLPTPPIIIGGGVRPNAAVRDVNIDFYDCQKGDDTFGILSLRFYGTDKYADALSQYNREHSGMIKRGSNLEINPPVLTSGQQVMKPPATLLDRDYATLIKTPQPQAKAIPSQQPIAKISNPPAPGPGGVYTVQNPAGESILDIAQRVFNDRSQWHRIYRLNPNYPPQNLIPAGTQLTLPSN